MADPKILKNPPTSGAILERRYSCSGDCLWVRFSPDQKEDWVGVFGYGNFRSQNFAVGFEGGDVVLVVAAGQGYIVRNSDGDLIRTTAWDYVQRIKPIADTDLMVLADDTSIWIENAHESVWKSDRVALDGVIVDEAKAAEVTGKVWWSEGWYGFRLTPSPWTFEKLELISTDWHEFGP